MQPLTLDDLLPLEEFAARRGEFFAAHARYLDRYRRVRVGPLLTLLFENRQTLWFRLQEVLRVARLTDPSVVQAELDWYNRLLPARHRLQAALLIDMPDGDGLADALRFWNGLPGSALRLDLGSSGVSCRLLTDRPADYASGSTHWVEFSLDDAARTILADFRRPARFVVEYASYAHHSAPLGEDVRQSQRDDLILSNRDGAA
jgi:hypothetical protein